MKEYRNPGNKNDYEIGLSKSKENKTSDEGVNEQELNRRKNIRKEKFFVRLLINN